MPINDGRDLPFRTYRRGIIVRESYLPRLHSQVVKLVETLGHKKAWPILERAFSSTSALSLRSWVLANHPTMMFQANRYRSRGKCVPRHLGEMISGQDSIHRRGQRPVQAS